MVSRRSLTRRAWIAGVAPLALGQALFAAGLDVEVTPRKITVGDPIEMTITADAPPGGTVFWPATERFAPAEVIRADTTLGHGARRTIRYTISLFEPGETDLPDLPVVIQTASDSDTLWVDAGRIEVASVVENPDTSSLRDIRPPVKLPWTFREMLPYFIGGLVALTAAIAGYILWRKAKLRRGEIPVYVPPPLPPDITAMRRLEELRVKRLWQDGRPKEYHSELTDILKEYIGARYDFLALEMTSEELFAGREKWADDEELFGRIRRILTIADLVKFAKLNPLPHDHEKSLEMAFAFVEATRLRPESVTAERA